METLTEQIDDDYEQSLKKFDMERHNFLHILEYLKHQSPMIMTFLTV